MTKLIWKLSKKKQFQNEEKDNKFKLRVGTRKQKKLFEWKWPSNWIEGSGRTLGIDHGPWKGKGGECDFPK